MIEKPQQEPAFAFDYQNEIGTKNETTVEKNRQRMALEQVDEKENRPVVRTR